MNAAVLHRCSRAAGIAVCALSVSAICCMGCGKASPSGDDSPVAAAAPQKPSAEKRVSAPPPASQPPKAALQREGDEDAAPRSSGDPTMKIEATNMVHPRLPDTLSLYALAPSRIAINDVVEPELTSLQDDNLLTHVACPVQEDTPCVVAVHFDEPVRVSAVRLFSGSGESRKAFNASGSAAEVRVVTDGGTAEAALKKHWDYAVVQLATAALTRSVRIEILRIHTKRKGASVLLSELDVLGDKGPSRPPLRLALPRLYTKSDGRFWRGDRFAAAWMEQTTLKGRRQRLFRGTAVYGKPDRRFYLAERVVDASCPGALYIEQKRYTLVDTHHRMFYTVPAPRGEVFSIVTRQRGEGFLFLGMDVEGDDMVFRPVNIDGETVRAFEVTAEEGGELERKIRAAGYPEEVLGWGGGTESAAVEGMSCRPVKRRNSATREAEKLVGLKPGMLIPSGHWVRCTVPGNRTVYLLNAPCDEEIPSIAAVQLPDGTVKARAFGIYNEIVLRVSGDGSVRLSAERNDGAEGDIFDLADDGSWNPIIRDALFEVGPAPNCRCSA